MTADKTLIAKTACEIVGLLKSDEISPLDLLDTLEERIAEVDPAVNALPTLCFDRARKAADAVMKRGPADRGVLAGAPVAIKDLTEVKGVRTTWGSPIYADHIAERNDLFVDFLEQSGGVVYAKSNTPEFGAGANTFNEVFGRTLNPWDTSKSCAGSSGGSAVALASGSAWLASGSDLGGSLRNPASFCSIVGMRPSPGRVAHDAPTSRYQNTGVDGPMARNVADVAMLLDAMVGEHPEDPISLATPATSFSDAVAERRRPLKVAFSRDLGVTPVDPEVAEICERAAQRFQELGAVVEEAHPDFTGLQDIFQTMRAIGFFTSKQELLETHRDKLKPEVIWNIDRARDITVEDVARVDIARGRIHMNMVAFMSEYDLLLSPATIVPPYPIEQRYVERLGDHEFSNYIEWCSIAYAITITGCPALSMPCGFTKSGLPVGLQVVGRQRGEADLLSKAALFEEVMDLTKLVPIIPRPPKA
ncbi:MAG: amidase [Rhodospirillaceae bacterium]|jgi:amidase|nr:amidase [Rhodospirillaceae bacterium]MBT6136330.1 amidase [Rhodospirillaceae bacterium]